MEYSMVTTEPIFPAMIWTEYGDILEETIIVRFILLKNTYILWIKLTQYRLLSIFMGTAVLLTLFSMVTLQRKNLKTLDFFLIIVVEKLSKFLLINQLLRSRKIKKLVQE